MGTVARTCSSVATGSANLSDSCGMVARTCSPVAVGGLADEVSTDSGVACRVGSIPPDQTVRRSPRSAPKGDGADFSKLSTVRAPAPEPVVSSPGVASFSTPAAVVSARSRRALAAAPVVVDGGIFKSASFPRSLLLRWAKSAQAAAHPTASETPGKVPAGRGALLTLGPQRLGRLDAQRSPQRHGAREQARDQ